MRAEFVEESVITPLTLLCGVIPKVHTSLPGPYHTMPGLVTQLSPLLQDQTISADDLTDIFESGDLIEEDVLPMMEMAMSLGLTKVSHE